MLALSGGTPDETEAWIEHACLGIKAETASRGGFRAWTRLNGERAERARQLGGRIRRHAYEADVALERAGVALLRHGLDQGDEVPEEAADAVDEPAQLVRGVLRRAPAAVAAVLVAAAVATIMVGGPLWLPAGDDGSSPRQGTLAGNEPRPTSSVATPEPNVAEAPPAATPVDAIVTVDFDRERMGQGLGAGWVQTAGNADAVALVPFPTAVNRSARLEGVDVAGAEACRPIADTTVRVSSLVVDVLVSDSRTTGVVIGRNAAGSPAVQVSFGTSGSAFAVGARDPSARADGLPLGEWIRTEITALGDQTLWRVTRETSDAVAERTMDVSALADVEQVCLAVAANSIGAAYFDNLAIATVKEG